MKEAYRHSHELKLFSLDPGETNAASKSSEKQDDIRERKLKLIQ